jgi:hypothetical protein
VTHSLKSNPLQCHQKDVAEEDVEVLLEVLLLEVEVVVVVVVVVMVTVLVGVGVVDEHLLTRTCGACCGRRAAAWRPHKAQRRAKQRKQLNE